MAHSAAEIFIIQLARTGAAPAHKYLRARGLQESDRDDIIGAATLWCWNNRTRYSLTTTLETWFMNAVRDAYKNFQRNELPTADVSVSRLRDGDITYQQAALRSTLKRLMGQLTSGEQNIVGLFAQGFTRQEIIAQGVSRQDIDNARFTVKRLLGSYSENGFEFDVARETFVALTTRTKKAPNLDDYDEADEREPSGIDAEIERLDFPPPSGKDCPPCWRCCYFEGFMPDGKRSTRMEIEDAEVREAVKDTETRKIEIAQRVRYHG